MRSWPLHALLDHNLQLSCNRNGVGGLLAEAASQECGHEAEDAAHQCKPRAHIGSLPRNLHTSPSAAHHPVVGPYQNTFVTGKHSPPDDYIRNFAMIILIARSGMSVAGRNSCSTNRSHASRSGQKVLLVILMNDV